VDVNRSVRVPVRVSGFLPQPASAIFAHGIFLSRSSKAVVNPQSIFVVNFVDEVDDKVDDKGCTRRAPILSLARATERASHLVDAYHRVTDH